MATKTKTCRNYRSLWKYEKTLHSIQDVKLPFPVYYSQIVIYGATAGICGILSKIPLFPFTLFDNWLISYLALPAAAAWFFHNQKIDGKNPISFIIARLRYFFTEPKHINRYKAVDTKKQVIRYGTNIGFREIKRGDQDEI